MTAQIPLAMKYTAIQERFLSFFFLFLAEPWGTQDISSPTRDRTQAPGSGNTES